VNAHPGGSTADPPTRPLAIGLAAGRLAIGAGLWLAPRRCARALGFEALDSTGLALARIAATRDLVLGAWQLRALDDRERLRTATLGVGLADTGDALAFTLALADRRTRRAGVRGLAGALPAALAGLWLAARLGPDRGAR
jgi:hypothetical protein